MAESRPLLERLLNTRDLPEIVPRLPPEILHRVIQTCGLEDCAEFVALATPGQLARVFDLDLWRVRARGGDEEFDADRFGVWLAVLMESGAAVAAEKLVGLDPELAIAGFAQHAAVYDHAAISSYLTLDGEHVQGRAMDRAQVAEIGGYLLEPRRTSAWDAIVELLTVLAAEHGEYFHRLMRGCVDGSNGPREQDGLHDLLEPDEQQMFDLASDREARRERQGYVTPPQAHAFLREGRQLRLEADRPAPSAIAAAYFRGIASPPATDIDSPSTSGPASAGSQPEACSELGPDKMAAVVEVLQEAGVLNAPPRALLGVAEGRTFSLAFIRAHAATHAGSAEEVAFLANAMIAGCTIQGRPFTAREASDGAVAICNLGLENWPSQWGSRDLVTAFQIGWTILHHDVGLYAAEHLIEVLGEIRCHDRDIRMSLEQLRRQLVQHVQNREPWRARHALDAIMMLDAPSWAALLALIDECPVMHAALSASRKPSRTINPTEFEFISENRQIAAVHEFMASLASILTE